MLTADLVNKVTRKELKVKHSFPYVHSFRVSSKAVLVSVYNRTDEEIKSFIKNLFISRGYAQVEFFSVL